MRVFVAGATGVIGRQLVPQLVDAGHAVVGSTRSGGKAGWLADAGATPAAPSHPGLDRPARDRPGRRRDDDPVARLVQRQGAARAAVGAGASELAHRLRRDRRRGAPRGTLRAMSRARDDVAIRTSGLGKRYGATVALAGLDLAVSAGEVYGYLGPNGAGKTTTIRLVLGLQRPSEGSAAVFGIDAWRDPVQAHRRVAFVAGEPMLWPALTGRESLEFLARLRGGVDEAYRGTLIDRFEFDARKRVRDYSKGNRQKIQLI